MDIYMRFNILRDAVNAFRLQIDCGDTLTSVMWNWYKARSYLYPQLCPRFAMKLHQAFLIFQSLSWAVFAQSDLSESFPSSHVIDTDVIILGGGSTGVFAAIQLRDKGKKVVVVEAKNRLGE